MAFPAAHTLSIFCPFDPLSASDRAYHHSAALNATWKYILLLVWQLFLRRQKWSTIVNTLVSAKWLSIQLLGKSINHFPLLLLLSGGRNQRSHTFNRIATHINAAILSAIRNRWSPLISTDHQLLIVDRNDERSALIFLYKRAMVIRWSRWSG